MLLIRSSYFFISSFLYALRMQHRWYLSSRSSRSLNKGTRGGRRRQTLLKLIKELSDPLRVVSTSSVRPDGNEVDEVYSWVKWPVTCLPIWGDTSGTSDSLARTCNRHINIKLT
jgi:hypothetical protein